MFTARANARPSLFSTVASTGEFPPAPDPVRRPEPTTLRRQTPSPLPAPPKTRGRGDKVSRFATCLCCFQTQPKSAAIALLLVLGLVQCSVSHAQGDAGDELRSTVQAPPNTRNLESAPGGAYFVDEELFDRYEALRVRLAQIREEIASGSSTSEAALQSLAEIQEQSQILRAQLDEKKVLVSAFKVFSKTSELAFPLGGERLVIITGDSVTVRGWEGPGLKCVIEKIILSKDRPDDSEFDAIDVEHKLEVAEDQVGLTREQRDAQEREFLASEDGRKLTEEQRAERRKFVDQIHHSFDDYLAFQGREANTLELKGLGHEEGNRYLSLRIESPEGGAMMSGQWRRHAKMTVYVPPCEALAVRGCQAGLDIQDVEGDLVLTAHGSRDRDYNGSFTVRGVKGDVTISQAPVRELSAVSGDVRITATDEFVNSGTLHGGGTRTFSTYEMHTTKIDQVGGDLQATILRTNLQLAAIGGAVDVVNEFGDTQYSVDSVDNERAHRIVSECGQIRVGGPASVLHKTPIYAHTQCGRLHTNLDREILDDASFSTGSPPKGWHGLVTPSEDRFDFSKFERPSAALENRSRKPGLDLISRGGLVSVLAADVEK